MVEWVPEAPAMLMAFWDILDPSEHGHGQHVFLSARSKPQILDPLDDRKRIGAICVMTEPRIDLSQEPLSMIWVFAFLRMLDGIFPSGGFTWLESGV